MSDMPPFIAPTSGTCHIIIFKLFNYSSLIWNYNESNGNNRLSSVLWFKSLHLEYCDRVLVTDKICHLKDRTQYLHSVLWSCNSVFSDGDRTHEGEWEEDIWCSRKSMNNRVELVCFETLSYTSYPERIEASHPHIWVSVSLFSKQGYW